MHGSTFTNSSSYNVSHLHFSASCRCHIPRSDKPAASVVSEDALSKYGRGTVPTSGRLRAARAPTRNEWCDGRSTGAGLTDSADFPRVRARTHENVGEGIPRPGVANPSRQSLRGSAVFLVVPGCVAKTGLTKRSTRKLEGVWTAEMRRRTRMRLSSTVVR
jgi:hypothetical protein